MDASCKIRRSRDSQVLAVEDIESVNEQMNTSVVRYAMYFTLDLIVINATASLTRLWYAWASTFCNGHVSIIVRNKRMRGGS